MNHQEFKNKLLKDKKLKQIYENPDVFFAISHSIFEMRVKHSLTQSALANLVGMQQEAIARLENPGYSVKYLISLQKIARALGTSLIPPKFKELADEESAHAEKIKILFASSAGNFNNLSNTKVIKNSSSFSLNY
jgi:transcriptional regulator with XRE-family HTH domain